MAVFRIEKNANYTVMSNYHLKERELTLKAKGLLSIMLSLPDEWDYSINGLVAICKENKTAITSALKELKTFGYLIIQRKHYNGRYEWEYVIYEKPFSSSKKEEKPKEEPIPKKEEQKEEKPREKIPYEEIKEMYHEICESYPKMIKLSDARKKLIKARYEEYDRDIDKFRELFTKAETSNFLKGNNDKGWKASFDWLLNTNNMIKVLENKYENKYENNFANNYANNKANKNDDVLKQLGL